MLKGKTKPIKYYGDVEDGLPVFTVLTEYTREHDGRKAWKCGNFVVDMENELEAQVVGKTK